MAATYRDPFPGNMIPVSRFDPISAKVLALVPQPLGGNAAAGRLPTTIRGRTTPAARPRFRRSRSIRTSAARAACRSTTRTPIRYVPRTPTGADAFPDQITASAASFNSGQTIRLNYDYTVTPAAAAALRRGLERQRLRAAKLTVNNYDAVQGTGPERTNCGLAISRGFVTAVNANTAIGGMSTLGTVFPDPVL